MIRQVVEGGLVGDVECISKCLVTSNKAKSNLGCAEEKIQTRGWV
jgi:hypothetical protein